MGWYTLATQYICVLMPRETRVGRKGGVGLSYVGTGHSIFEWDNVSGKVPGEEKVFFPCRQSGLTLEGELYAFRHEDGCGKDEQRGKAFFSAEKAAFFSFAAFLVPKDKGKGLCSFSVARHHRLLASGKIQFEPPLSSNYKLVVNN